MHEGVKMRKALTAFALAAALAVVVGPAVAHAQDYPPVSEDLTVSDSTVVPGQSITISGSGAEPNSTVSIYLFSAPILLGTTTADGDGTFSATVTIPAGVSPGTHTLRAIQGGEVLASVALVVVGSGSGGSSGSDLPFTGGTTLPGIGIGVGLIAVGSTLLLLSRRRRSQREHETVA
jgi:5'-nucleotidase